MPIFESSPFGKPTETVLSPNATSRARRVAGEVSDDRDSEPRVSEPRRVRKTATGTATKTTTRAAAKTTTRTPRKSASKASVETPEKAPEKAAEKTTPATRTRTRRKAAPESAESPVTKSAPSVESASPEPPEPKVRRTRKKLVEAEAVAPTREPVSEEPRPRRRPRRTRTADTTGEAPAAEAPRQTQSESPARPERSPDVHGTGPREPRPATESGERGESRERPDREDRFSRKNRRRFRPRRRDRRDRFAGNDRRERSEDGDYAGGGDASDFEALPPDDGSPPVFQEGVVEVSGKGFGFLREAKSQFLHSKYDTFVTPEVIRRHNLRDGVFIKGQVRRGVRGPQLFKLTEIEGRDPESFGSLPVFEELTTINPIEWLRLETVPDRYTTRVIDLMAPVGKGQRGLIVAPPRTGKTTLLQHIAEAVVKNHPEMKLIVLLVDERPEEVTEIRRTLPQAQLFASSNDSDIKSHTRIAQLAIERARRLVEMGEDVFLLMDSLTRVGRAFNNAQNGGGRTMSGGVDTRALEIPRRLFASARNTEEAGSLTIMATALIETGSRMDELIFLEFKGTGNMELVLDRRVSDQRIYPAVDIFQSGTRREELLLSADSLHKISVIRRGLAGHKPLEAIERLLFFLRKHPTNAEMLAGIPG